MANSKFTHKRNPNNVDNFRYVGRAGRFGYGHVIGCKQNWIIFNIDSGKQVDTQSSMQFAFKSAAGFDDEANGKFGNVVYLNAS